MFVLAISIRCKATEIVRRSVWKLGITEWRGLQSVAEHVSERQLWDVVKRAAPDLPIVIPGDVQRHLDDEPRERLLCMFSADRGFFVESKLESGFPLMRSLNQ